MEKEDKVFDINLYADNVVLKTEGKIFQYNELNALSQKLGHSIGSRCLVFLFCSNVPDAIIGYVGMLNNGIVPVMLDSELDEDMAGRLIDAYKPQYLWLPARKADEYPSYEEKFRMSDYVLLSTGDKAYELNQSLALLMTTSGSTGSPKLVRISYENIRANTEAIIKYLHITQDEVGITSLPMHYVYGLSIINSHLWAGASLVVTDKTMFQREFWQAMKEYGVTNLGGVPYTYEMLKRLRFFRMDLPALHTLTQAGGKLKKELHQEFAEYAVNNGKDFVVMYGAAEATARMGYLPPEMANRKISSMGIAIPGGCFELQAADGGVIDEEGIAGELVYYGRNVTMGYAMCREDLLKGDENHGCYCTGDIAVRDADGIYTIVGRKKRFLKLFGKRTNLQETEDILKSRYKEKDIACSGIDDHLFIFVSDEPGTENESVAKEMVGYISQKLGLHHSAFTVRILDELPRNAAGKVLYHELEQYYDI